MARIGALNYMEYMSFGLIRTIDRSSYEPGFYQCSASSDTFCWGEMVQLYIYGGCQKLLPSLMWSVF